MLNKRNVLILAIILWMILPSYTKAQSDTAAREVKKGWTFGALPAIAYDTDRGFKYGGLVNFFNYGDGNTYPEYLQSIYLEWSRTTKGSGINQLRFDTERLTNNIPVRLTVDLSYFTEKSMDFYGFNGYESGYRPEFEDDNSGDYISRMFYRYERNLFHFSAIFQNQISNSNLKWLAGIENFTHKLQDFDFNRYNEGNENNQLKDTITLFELYENWGLISHEEADGGMVNYLKAGMIYDTRDQKANPMKGMWSEVLFSAAPAFLWNNENQYLKLSFIHRQYLTLIPEDLNLAFRLGYQGTILGKAPFYMQSYLMSSYTESVNVEGLGGQKSLRGILRNRILGDDIAYSNLELRWKFWRMNLFKQNIYIAWSAFWDNGMVVDPISINKDMLPPEALGKHFLSTGEKGVHSSVGTGIHLALNNNFILAVDYGKALDKRDGTDGLYIGLNFLY
ncbi:MAG: Omp85 family outer membrane protein [Bacteroidota bacterium]